MSRPHSKNAFVLPSYWTARQALAVFECLELLQEHLWAQYGTQIQRAYRDDLLPPYNPHKDPRQLPLPFIDDTPF